jgi:pimeloyl-ACP methyl ester carboxylesterase
MPGACSCCPTSATPPGDLFNFYAPPQPYRQPTIVPNETYTPANLKDVSPAAGPGGVVKWDRDVAYWWMTLCRASYAPTAAWPTRALNALKPTSQVLFTPNSSSLTPGWFAGVWEDGVCIVVSGTTNFVQALNYILLHASDMQGGTGWTVNRAWYQAANAILPGILPLMVPSDKFVFLLGHSYGAAVAATITALLPQSQVLGQSALATAGSPAYGSTAFCNRVANVQTLRIANVGDAVPYLPPPSMVGYATAVANPNFRLNPGTYRHCNPPTLLRESGGYATGAFEEQDPGVWFSAAAGFLANNPTNIVGHRMREYTRRALLTVPTIPGSFMDRWAFFTDLPAINDEMDAAGN